MPPADVAGTGGPPASVEPPLPGRPAFAAGGAAPPPLAASMSARSGPTRATPAVLVAIAALLLAARVGLGVYEHVRPVERLDRVEWRDPAAGEAEARERGWPILYWFTRDGDPLGRQMSREVFADPRASAAIEERFVPVRVLDLSGGGGRNPPEVAQLVSRYAVREFPTLVVAFPGRERFERQAGYPGAMATTRFFSRALTRLMMRGPGGGPGQPSPAAPDSGI